MTTPIPAPATVFDDMASDLDFDGDNIDTMDEGRTREAARQRFTTARNAAVYSSPCKRCSGSGNFYGYSGRYVGPCNACKGAGTIAYTTDAAHREKNREQYARKKVEALQANHAAFAAEHPAQAAWLESNRASFEFAADLYEKVGRFGSLFPGALAAIDRCRLRDEDRTAARQQQHASPPEMAKLHDVMQKHAKFYAGDLTLSRRNQDQLVWVKHAAAEKVVGKIDGGRLTLWPRPGVDMGALRELLDEFEGNPLQAAVKYGRLSGRCCSCGRDLTDETSVAAGIGPVCATKFE